MTLPRDPGEEPHESEFCHGRGLMPPLSKGYEPTNLDEHLALRRLNKKSDRSDVELSYDEVIREP